VGLQDVGRRVRGVQFRWTAIYKRIQGTRSVSNEKGHVPIILKSSLCDGPTPLPSARVGSSVFVSGIVASGAAVAAVAVVGGVAVFVAGFF